MLISSPASGNFLLIAILCGMNSQILLFTVTRTVFHKIKNYAKSKGNDSFYHTYIHTYEQVSCMLHHIISTVHSYIAISTAGEDPVGLRGDPYTGNKV